MYKIKSEKQRDSNMELLRLVAMCMIVILHLDIFLLEESHLYIDQPFASFFVFFLKSLTIIGVNVFVLLSGWYGITFKWNRFASLWFQVLFFTAAGLIYDFFNNGNTINIMSILYHLFQMDGNAYGFFQSYLILYIFSPILNLFTQNTNKKTIIELLCVFFIIQIIWGCISWGYAYFGNGYSALSYIGLYIFARYARINKIQYQLKCYQWGVLYILISLFSSITAYFAKSHTYIYNFAYSYASPLVILSAFSMLAFFSRLKIKSNIINQIAIHCFAIYLFHMNYYILPKIIETCTSLDMHKEVRLFLEYLPLVCIVIFALSIFFDICRLFIWNKVCFMYKQLCKLHVKYID